MARIRTIKPEFWTHEDLSALPAETHMLAAALLNHSDDEGYFNAHPGLVKAACCPLREDSVSVQSGLKQLCGVGYIRVGTGTDGKHYGHVITFDSHQRVNRPTESKIKHLVSEWEPSVTNHGVITEPSPPERKGMEGKGKECAPKKEKASSSKPTPLDDSFSVSERVEAWAKEKGHSRLPDHLESFKSKCRAKGYTYVDWDSAFMEAIRGDWAKLSTRDFGGAPVRARARKELGT